MHWAMIRLSDLVPNLWGFDFREKNNVITIYFCRLLSNDYVQCFCKLLIPMVPLQPFLNEWMEPVLLPNLVEMTKYQNEDIVWMKKNYFMFYYLCQVFISFWFDNLYKIKFNLSRAGIEKQKMIETSWIEFDFVDGFNNSPKGLIFARLNGKAKFLGQQNYEKNWWKREKILITEKCYTKEDDFILFDTF